MKKTGSQSIKMFVRYLSFVAVSLIILFGTSTGTRADETDAKRILKAMSDYMAAQKKLSFGFDAILEVITSEDQKLALASSGAVTLQRPDKICFMRSSGFADIEMNFDGKTLTLLGKTLNLYTQLNVPGTIDHLVDELKDKHNRPLPAADLLMSNSYDELMENVIDIKDLGISVIGGIECDHLAFRTADVDWQIWIAQGEHPYPYRYVITSKLLNNGPQYAIQFNNWKTGGEVAVPDFHFKNLTQADKVDMKDLKGTDVLPDHFTKGDAK